MGSTKATTPTSRKRLEEDQTLVKRFKAYGVPISAALEMIRLIERWVGDVGPEEAVARLKGLRQFRLDSYLGRTNTAYIARHRDGTPKGPFRVLWNLPQLSFMKAWNALMVYSHFRGVKITSRQWAKFKRGVLRTPPSDAALTRAKTYIDLGLEAWLKHGVRIPPPPEAKGIDIFQLPRSDSRRSPLFGNLRLTQPEALLDSAFSILTDGGSFYESHSGILNPVFSQVQELVDEHLDDHLSASEEFGYSLRQRTAAGALAVVQEPGYKGRFIANPYSSLQAAGYPLYKWSVALVSSLPGNYQFDQSEGLRQAQRLLKKHGYAHSVDLEGATDNFPRDLVAYAMGKLGLSQEWIAFYLDVSSLAWHLPSDWEDVAGLSEIQWTVGQPLGWYPTFNLALSITLGALSEGICSHASGDECYEAGSCRTQVGDDLIHFGEEEGELLVDVLEDLGVPVSKAKSLKSTKCCEFLSRLITTDQVISGFKWKSPNDDSFLEIVRFLGKAGLPLLTRQQRIAVNWLAPVPEPWGLGWNPQGIPALSRIDSFVNLDVTGEQGRQLMNADLSNLRALASSSIAQVSNRNHTVTADSDLELFARISTVFGPGRDPAIYGQWLASLVSQVGDVVRLLRAERNSVDTDSYLSEIRRLRRERMMSLLPPFIVDSLKPAADMYGWEESLVEWYDCTYQLFAQQSGNPYKSDITKLSLVERKARELCGLYRSFRG